MNQKSTIKTLYKRLWCIILCFLILNLSPVSLISGATWTASLNNKLAHYYSFSETTGVVGEDLIGEKNFTMLNIEDADWVAGKVGNCINFDAGVERGSADPFNLTADYSISFWVYLDAIGTTPGFLEIGDATDDGIWIFNGGGTPSIQTEGPATQLLQPALGTGVWRMITVTYDNSTRNLTLYSNGTAGSSHTGGTSNAPLVGSHIFLGNSTGGNGPFDGSIDELGMWNKTLTASEISTLYNLGSGVAYDSSADVDVILDSPSDDNKTLGNNIIFSANLTSLAGSLDNATLYLWHSNGSVITNFTDSPTGTDYVVNQSLNNLGLDNTIKWNYYTCSNSIPDCRFASSNFTLSIKNIIENSETYNTNIQETSNQSFQINITYDSSAYPTITGSLVYNNTEYTGTKIGTGNTILFNISVIATDVTATNNIPFYWKFGLNDGSTITYANSTFHNQSVNPLSAINITTAACSAGWFESANYTFKDAENLTSLKNMSIKYNFDYGVGGNASEELYGEFNNTNILRICINETVNDYKIGYGEIDYQQTGYVERRYYMFDGHSLSNSTGEEFILYDLPTGDSTSFIFEIKNTFLNPYTDKYIGLLRWYPDLNEYKTVEMALTDADGKTVMKVHTEDVDYRVGVYDKDGTLIKLADPVRMACLVNPCTYTLRIVSDEEDYTELFGVETSLEWNSVLERFVFTWNDPSQNTVSMRLLVTKDLGFQYTTVCNVTGAGSTGVLVCDIVNASGTYKAVGYRTASPATVIISKIIDIRTRMNNSWGLFISFMLMLTAALIGIFSPVGAIIMMVFGAIPAYLLGSINWVILMGIGVLGGLIIHVIKKT